MLNLSNIHCCLNINDGTLFSMALKVGKTVSDFTTKKQANSSILTFDEVLSVPIDQNALDLKDQKKQKCEIMLYRFNSNQSRQSKHLVGIGSITITKELLKQTNKRIKITNMLDSGCFVDCLLKIQLKKSQQIFQLNESRISQFQSKSDIQSLNCLQDLKIQHVKKNKQFSQKAENKSVQFNIVVQKISESCKLQKIKTSDQENQFDHQKHKVVTDFFNNFLSINDGKYYKNQQEIKKTNSRIINENDLSSAQRYAQKESNKDQNEPLIQLCTNLQNQNTILMNKIMELQLGSKNEQFYGFKPIQENNRNYPNNTDKSSLTKNLSIKQTISVTYRPVLSGSKAQSNSSSHSELRSSRSFTKFNSKSKYLALGLVKNEQKNIFKKEYSTQTSLDNLMHQNNSIKINNQNNQNMPQYKLNVNGINFEDFRKKQLLETKKSELNETKVTITSTFEPINLMIEQKYRKNQKLLKKFNQNLTQQVKKLKQENKKLSQQLTLKKNLSLQKFQLLQNKCLNQQIEIKKLSQNIKQKDERIEYLEIKIIEIESEKMNIKQELKQQRKSIGYFLKSSHVIDQKLKQISESKVKKPTQQVQLLKPLQMNKSIKNDIRQTASRDLKLQLNKINASPKYQFRQTKSSKHLDQSSLSPTSLNNNFFTSRSNLREKNLVNIKIEDQCNLMKKNSQQNHTPNHQSFIKLYKSKKISETQSGLIIHSAKKQPIKAQNNPNIYQSGLFGTGQTIFQSFVPNSTR